MIKEQTGYGSTIEEAYEAAKTNLILELGAEKYNEDDIQFDITQMPKKKTLGLFGGCQAEVKAFIELPDAPKPKANKPKKELVRIVKNGEEITATVLGIDENAALIVESCGKTDTLFTGEVSVKIK